MIIGIIIILIILALALAGVGSWIVIKGNNQDSQAPIYAPIDRSGSYAVLRHPVHEDLRRAKPSTDQVEAWFRHSHPELGEEKIQDYIAEWNQSLAKTIATIEEGDREKVATFRVFLTEKDLPLCQFLSEDNYVTREQILNHPEILPPYYLGCGCRLTLKSPWENPSKSGWKAVVPGQDGKYAVPDWKTLA